MSVSEQFFSEKKCQAIDRMPKNLRDLIDYFQTNKAQNCIVGGILLMVYSAQNIGWGIFNGHLRSLPVYGGYEDEGEMFWTVSSWYLACIGGLLFGSILVNKYSKFRIYIFGSLLSSIGATCFITHPANLYMVLVGRIFSGISHGITYPTVLIHACEVAAPKIRGYNVSIVNFSLIIGFVISSSNLSDVYKARSYELDPTNILGFNGLLCIISGLILLLLFNIESPVFLIKKYQEEEALENITRLRSESHEILAVRQEFDEFIIMAKEDTKSSTNLKSYVHQFAILLILKSIAVCSFNMPLNEYFLDVAKLLFYDGTNDKSGMYLMSVRATVAFISMIFVDWKRINLFVISTLGSSLCLIILYLMDRRDEPSSFYYPVGVILLFQAFSGVALVNIADIYLTDSVNSRLKPFFIFLTTSFEYGLQVMLIACYFYLKVEPSYLLSIFGAVIASGIVLVKFLPDTSRHSLREARNMFKHRTR